MKKQTEHKIYYMNPEGETLVDTDEFLSLLERDQNIIRSAKFLRPRLDGNSFGKFLVQWKHNRYRKMMNVE